MHADAAGAREYADADPLLRDAAGAGAAPARIYGTKVLTLSLVVSVGGLLFGFDTGVISGAMPYLRDDLLQTYVSQPSRLALVQETIVGAAIAAAAAGSAAGGLFSDRCGRRAALLCADALFALGSACMAAAGGVSALLVGRALVGLAVGLASVTAPVYIAECAPPAVRAALVTLNVLAITSGQFLAYLTNYAFSFVPGTWRWMLGVAAGPAVLQLIGLALLPESPAWLASHGRSAEAKRAATRLQLGEVDSRAAGQGRSGSAAWRALLSPGVRNALHVGVGLQVLQQLAGINTVMYFAPTIIQLAGIHDNRSALLVSLLPAGVNALGTVAGMLCIDRFGRRRLLLASVAAVVVALVALGGAFALVAAHAPPVDAAGSTCSSGESALASCAACLRAGCGFCGPADSAAAVGAAGTCLQPSQQPQSACAGQLGWQLYTTGCPSAYGVLTLGLLMAYLAAFSPGLGPVPWAVNSEIYPLQVRGLATGVAATANWGTNFVVAQTFLTLMRALGAAGTFWLYAAIACCGLLWVWAALPETRGLSMDEIQILFAQRAVAAGGGAQREIGLTGAAGRA